MRRGSRRAVHPRPGPLPRPRPGPRHPRRPAPRGAAAPPPRQSHRPRFARPPRPSPANGVARRADRRSPGAHLIQIPRPDHRAAEAITRQEPQGPQHRVRVAERPRWTPKEQVHGAGLVLLTPCPGHHIVIAVAVYISGQRDAGPQQGTRAAVGIHQQALGAARCRRPGCGASSGPLSELSEAGPRRPTRPAAGSPKRRISTLARHRPPRHCSQPRRRQGDAPQIGMLPCFFGGFRSRLFSRLSKASISRARVFRGSSTSST